MSIKSCIDCGAGFPAPNPKWVRCRSCGDEMTIGWVDDLKKQESNQSELLNVIYELLDDLDKQMIRESSYLSKHRLRKVVFEVIRAIKADIRS